KMGVPRPRSALVIMRKEFGPIGGDIHVGGAFRFTRLAGKAKIQRLLYVFVLPAVADHLALQQLKKHVSAPASAVLLLHCHHVTGAHRADMRLPAFSEPHATQGGFGKGTAVIREVKMGFRTLR